jgi:CRISPR/Cas system CMR-associated protein Cmr5 small subunit
MDNTIHIIFAGCSFSDDGNRTDKFDINILNKNNKDYVQQLGLPNTVKMHKLLALDLVNQGISNVKIHPIARGSYGNHVIADKLKQKVNELKESNPNEKIYAVIQLSAFLRRTPNNIIQNGLDINVENYPYDYMDSNIEFNNMGYRDIFIKHFKNIENISNFCKENDVENYMFFGWANVFTYDVVKYSLKNDIERLKEIVNFFPYLDTADEIEHYCAGTKEWRGVKDASGRKLYMTPGDKYGGLTEYTRERLKVGERYFFDNDPHPSTAAYNLFYNEILKKWFIETGIINDVELNEFDKNIIETILYFEYNRYMNLWNYTNNDIFVITDETYNFLNKTEFNKKNIKEFIMYLNDNHKKIIFNNK